MQNSLFIVTPIVGFCNCSMFCCALLCVISSFATIFGKIAGCFAFYVFLVSHDCCVTLPRGAAGLSAVCDDHTQFLRPLLGHRYFPSVQYS